MAWAPWVGAVALAACLAAPAAPLPAQPARTPDPAAAADTSRTPDPNLPAVIEAGRIAYDRERDAIVAEGGVYVVQGDRALSADRIEYFLAEDRIVATGGVTLLEPGGETAQAERIELTGGLKRAVADRLGVSLADGSRLVGRRVERRAGVGTTLNDGAFTPCLPCAEDPESAPLWRLRARKVEHDEGARDIKYEDVTLDIAGTPVFYLPYFSHPDPTVERRTGFLTPTLFFGGEFDAVAQVPYYWSLAPNQDLTLKPIFTIRSAPIAAIEYRHLFESGQILFDGSLGWLGRVDNQGGDDGEEWRGHAFVNGEFVLDEIWRLRFDGRVASDDSYLETFNIEDADILRSQIALEGFWQESYVRVGGFGAQDLREDAAQDVTPIAAPEVHAALVGRDTPFGAPFVNLDGRLLERDDGTDGQSASATVGWRAPYITPGGHSLDLEASLRGDVYNTRNAQALGAEGDDTVTRGVPTLVAGWRYPMIRQERWGAFIVEPRLQAVLGLDDARNRDVPNEDSRAVEYDELNFFAPDRFTGLDLIDDGQRIDYGLTATALFPEGGRASGFIGQSLAREPGDFAAEAGMTGRSSDIVTALTATPAPWLDLAWRMRFAKDKIDVRRNEIVIGGGPEWLRVSGAYVEIDGEAQGPERSEPAHQIRLGAALSLDENWRVSARHHRDLSDDRSLLWAASIAYENECLSVDVGYVHDYVSQADGGGDEHKLLLRVNFKHLGGLDLSQGIGGSETDR